MTGILQITDWIIYGTILKKETVLIPLGTEKVSVGRGVRLVK